MKIVVKKEELDKINSLYEQYGNNITIIANKLACSRSKVRKLLVSAGITFSKESKDILNLYNNGYSVKDISIKLGLNIKTVNEYIPYHTYQLKDELKSKKTISNIKSLNRKKALNNIDDHIGMLKAFSEHKKYKYIYQENGILIDNELIDFNDKRVKELIKRIIEDNNTK